MSNIYEFAFPTSADSHGFKDPGLSKLEYFTLKIYCAKLISGMECVLDNEDLMNRSIHEAKELLGKLT